ncbi:MAG TPA: TIM barrel protein [Opitutus sp.]|nr:TIM barrel protein [Opitutus sp.]
MKPDLSRREALASLAGLAALATLPRLRGAAAAASSPPMTPAQGAIHHSVCKWCYPKISVEELAQAAPSIGLESIELVGPDDFATLKKHGLICAMVTNPIGRTPQGVEVGGIPKAWNRLEHHDTLVEIYERRIAETADAGFPNLICFSGNREGMPDEQGLENCLKGLQRIMPLAEKRGVMICMELLNSKVNHHDYMCDHTPWGVELVRRIGSPNFKLLYDIYHMQIMEGDVIHTITDNHEFIAHYHTGGVPGRHEIDEEQELFYPAIMRGIKATGYTGYVAQEFIPTRDPLASLAEGIRICTV